MPLNKRAIIQVLQLISVEKGLKCTVVSALKGAGIVGACAFAGGLLAGPLGLSLGGIAGSVYTLINKSDFKSVGQVLAEEMTESQRRQLELNFMDIFRDIDANDVTAAAALIMGSSSLQALVLKELGCFLKDEMGLQLMA